jgi:uncharacterized protein (DUF433 family)
MLWYSVGVVRKSRQMQRATSHGREHPYVERRPGVCGGEPVIVGTRFPVRSVVTSVYRLGLTPEEMVEAWPYLTLAHVHDALSFYHDHRAVIDRAIRQNRETTVRRGVTDLDVASKRRGRISRRSR